MDSKDNLKANTEQLIANFKQIAKNGGKENKIALQKYKTFKRLWKNDQTLKFDDLINLTNIKTTDEKKALKKLKKNKTAKFVDDITYLSHFEYKNQRTNFLHLFDHDMTEVNRIESVTIEMKNKSTILENSIKHDEKKYQNQLRNFLRMKNSFLKFYESKEDRHNIIKNEMNIEVQNAQLAKNEMVQCERIRADASNKLLRLQKEMMVPEACYMILTWLSPPEWRAKLNVQKLKYDFKTSNDDLIQEGNYRDYAYQKKMIEFEEDLRTDMVVNVYWESAEQIIAKLARLEKKTRDKQTVMDEIVKPMRSSDCSRDHNDSSSKFKKNILQNKNHISHMLSATELLSDQDIVIKNEAVFKIKSMLVEMHEELNIRMYGDTINITKALNALFTRLDELRLEYKKIPSDMRKIVKQIYDEKKKLIKGKSLCEKISIHRKKCTMNFQ